MRRRMGSSKNLVNYARDRMQFVPRANQDGKRSFQTGGPKRAIGTEEASGISHQDPRPAGEGELDDSGATKNPAGFGGVAR
jgi:hypothetical protein